MRRKNNLRDVLSGVNGLRGSKMVQEWFKRHENNVRWKKIV